MEGLSGQLQWKLAAISGSLAGGVSDAGEQTPAGVTQALGCGWGCAWGVASVHMAKGKGYVATEIERNQLVVCYSHRGG